MGGRKHLNNMYSQIHGAYALKNIQKVLSTHKYSSLAKGGACWPFYSEQQHSPNIERVGPRSVAPQLREVASTVGDPRSLP
jgi:hypothetical protein